MNSVQLLAQTVAKADRSMGIQYIRINILDARGILQTIKDLQREVKEVEQLLLETLEE